MYLLILYCPRKNILNNNNNKTKKLKKHNKTQQKPQDIICACVKLLNSKSFSGLNFVTFLNVVCRVNISLVFALQAIFDVLWFFKWCFGPEELLESARVLNLFVHHFLLRPLRFQIKLYSSSSQQTKLWLFVSHFCSFHQYWKLAVSVSNCQLCVSFVKHYRLRFRFSNCISSIQIREGYFVGIISKRFAFRRNTKEPVVLNYFLNDSSDSLRSKPLL